MINKTIIKPDNLFSDNVHNFEVMTNKKGKIRYVNFDSAATTPPLKQVEKDLSSYISSYGSVHRGAGYKSIKSTDIYENSREIIKDFVNSQKDSYVIFTGNTTGSMNMAAHFFSHLKGKIAVSQLEHSSSWLPWIKAEGEKNIGEQQIELKDIEKQNKSIQEEGRKQVIQYNVNKDFEFDLNEIKKLLENNKIKVFVLTAASNVTGYIPEIKKIGELVHKYGSYFLVDACQFIQHNKIDMEDMGIDFLAASGHKFYAPYGGGFLIGPKKFLDKFLPYQIGGGNLPYITKQGEFLKYDNNLSHDPGTPNAIGAITMASAFKKLSEIGIENIKKYEHNLAFKIYNYLEKKENVKLYVSKKHLNTVIPFNIKGKNGKKIAEKLNSDYGIGVRVGAFCTYNLIRKLLKIEDEQEIIDSVKKGESNKIPSLIRVSVSLTTTEEDIERFIEAMDNLI